MKTALVTDTNSGISREEAEKLGIFLIPMPVIIDGEIRYEGKDLGEQEFFDSLLSGKNVTTSQPSPGEVTELWEKLLNMGYDRIIHIPMSSGLSKTCETAWMLARDYDGKVRVVDNHRISFSQQEAVREAKRLADMGVPAEEIGRRLEEQAYDASIYIAVDTLEFLKKGGRVTPAAAALGTVLKIKPILSIQGDKLDAFAKVRGMKKGKTEMIRALQHDLDTRFADVDRRKITIGTAGAGLDPETIAQWKQTVEEAFPGMGVYYTPLSFSIASHTGPGAMGIGLSVSSLNRQ